MTERAHALGAGLVAIFLLTTPASAAEEQKASPVYKAQAVLKDASGKVVGWDLAPKSLIGPDGAARRPDQTQHEKTEGNPLAGELTDVVISDDTKLLRVLDSVGVPIDRLEVHYGGTYDSVRRTVRPGLGAGEKAFTFYGLGDAPAPRTKQTQSPKPSTGGFLRRLFKG